MTIQAVTNNSLTVSASVDVTNNELNYLSYYQFFELMQKMQLTDVLNSTQVSELLNQIQSIINNTSKSEYQNIEEITKQMGFDTKISAMFGSWATVLLIVALMIPGGAAFALVPILATAGTMIVQSVYKIKVAIKEMDLANAQATNAKNSTMVDFMGTLNEDLASTRMDSMRKLKGVLSQANSCMSYQQQTMGDIGSAGRKAKN